MPDPTKSPASQNTRPPRSSRGLVLIVALAAAVEAAGLIAVVFKVLSR